MTINRVLLRLWCGRKPDFRVKLIPYFRFLAKGDGRSYLAMESPFIATVYHTTYHFGLYLYQFLYQFLYQLFLRCISPYPPYNINFFWRLCHKRMRSRHDEKGGDGMSISASSVTLAAWSSSWWGFPAEVVNRAVNSPAETGPVS